jgi:hypothetical protein
VPSPVAKLETLYTYGSQMPSGAQLPEQQSLALAQPANVVGMQPQLPSLAQ